MNEALFGRYHCSHMSNMGNSSSDDTLINSLIGYEIGPFAGDATPWLLRLEKLFAAVALFFLPSVFSLFKYKPTAAGHPAGAIYLER